MGLTIAANRVLLTKGEDKIFDTQEPMPHILMHGLCCLNITLPKPQFAPNGNPHRAWLPSAPRHQKWRKGRHVFSEPVTSFPGGGPSDFVCGANVLSDIYETEIERQESVFSAPGGWQAAPKNQGPYSMLACNFSMKVGLHNISGASRYVEFVYGRLRHHIWPTSVPLGLQGKHQTFSGSMILNQVHKRGQGAVITEIMGLYVHEDWVVLEYEASHAYSPGWAVPDPFPDEMFHRRFDLDIFLGRFS